MFAGKTSYMLAELRKELVAKRKIVLIKHVKDKRYSSEARVVTHDNVSMTAIERTSLRQKEGETDDGIMSADVIGVDEGQFFDDIAEACEMWANMGIRVIVAACQSTYNRKPFKHIPELLAKSDIIVHLTAICVGCYGPASFTERVRSPSSTPEPSPSQASEIHVGGSELYSPVCRDCYYERGLKRSAVQLDT